MCATEIVTVYGSNFEHADDISCKFESGDGSGNNVIVDAIFIDSNSIICPLDESICHGKTTTQIVNIFVSENGKNFIRPIGTNYNFSYYLPPKITYSSNSFVYSNQIAWTLFIVDWVCIDTISTTNVNISEPTMPLPCPSTNVIILYCMLDGVSMYVAEIINKTHVICSIIHQFGKSSVSIDLVFADQLNLHEIHLLLIIYNQELIFQMFHGLALATGY